MDCFTAVLTRTLPAGRNTIAPGLPPPSELSAHSGRPRWQWTDKLGLLYKHNSMQVSA